MTNYPCRILLAFLLLWSGSCQPAAEEQKSSAETIDVSSDSELIARADSFELDTKYVPPPGDPLSHHASGFAKILCSAVFITGLDFDFAAENIGYFTAPYEERAKFAKRELDMEEKAVHVTLPNGMVRTAKYFGDQGCICLPEGQETLNFTPQEISITLPDPATQPWPMGDLIEESPAPEVGSWKSESGNH